MSTSDNDNPVDFDITTDDILVVRRGPGANCSSVGSALDVLFLSAALAGVILAGVAAAIGDYARSRPSPPPPDNKEKDSDARST